MADSDYLPGSIHRRLLRGRSHAAEKKAENHSSCISQHSLDSSSDFFDYAATIASHHHHFLSQQTTVLCTMITVERSTLLHIPLPPATSNQQPWDSLCAYDDHGQVRQVPPKANNGIEV
jgi:hypothetical protein